MSCSTVLCQPKDANIMVGGFGFTFLGLSVPVYLELLARRLVSDSPVLAV